MADNIQAGAAVGSGPVFATASLTFSGDTVNVPLGAQGILSGSEGAWTHTLYVGGAGAVTAGVQRMTLASDDPAVAALQIMDDWDETNRCAVNVISGQVGIAGGTGVDGATVPRVTLATNVALPAGTNAIGKLSSNSGVDIGDVDVTSIAAGDNNIGNVDIVTVPTDPFGANADAASATGSISAKLRFIASTGIPITGTVTVGSHAVTNAGTFVVQVDGTALTALQLIDDCIYTDDGAWTGDTSKHALVGGIYQSSPQTITDGKTGPVQVTTNGYQIVSVNGTVTVASHAVTNAGTFAVQATCTNAGTFAVQAACTNAGTFVVQVDGSALTSLQLIDDAIFTDDAAFTPATSKLMVIGAQADETAPDSVDEGDAGALRMTLERKLRVVASIDSASMQSGNDQVIPKFAIIDAATSGDNTLQAAVADKKLRVLAVVLVAAGAVNARFESGASGTALTGQMNLTTNSGFVLPYNPVGWFEAAANTLLNLELSGAVSVDGCLTYIEVD